MLQAAPRPRVSFLTLLVLLASGGGWAAAQDVAADKLAQIRPRFEKFVADGQLAGAVTVVGRHDKILSLETVGDAIREDQKPMRKDTMFRIASMTKPITALGIMLLVDEGKLSVEDPVEKHLPEFKGQKLVADKSGDTLTLKNPPRPITLRDLLTHTSGLPAGPPVGLSDLYAKRNRTLAEGVLVFSQQPLQFEPGTKWAYCNAGIDTLGRIIEVVSGTRYEDFLRQRVFEPIGMPDTTFYPSDAQLARVAMTYDSQDGKLIPNPATVVGPPAGAKYPIPAGGLYSTAHDLAKLYQMFLSKGMAGDKRIVSEAALAAMTKLQTGDIPCGFVDGMGFGFGVGVVREPKGVTGMLSAGSYGHGGAFGTQGWMDPHKDLFVILLIQRTGLKNGDASEMRQALQELAAAAVTPAQAQAPAPALPGRAVLLAQAPIEIPGGAQGAGGAAQPDDATLGRAINLGELVFVGKVKQVAHSPAVGLSSPPLRSMTIEFSEAEPLRGTPPQRLSFTYSVRAEVAPSFLVDSKQLVVAREIPRTGWTISQIVPASDSNLKLARTAVELPMGWSLADSKPLSPWASAGTWHGPAGKGAVCSKSGRPALLAGKGVEIKVDQVPPAKLLQFKNPFGDGEFKVTVTNTSQAPVTVPALLTDGKEILWDASLVVIHGDKPYLLEPHFPAGELSSKTLAPGESVSGVVNTLKLPGVPWPRGGSRVYLTFALGDISAGNFFYFFTDHHQKLIPKGK